ncbi:MAG: thiol peroxidase [Bacteroidota bacterium]
MAEITIGGKPYLLKDDIPGVGMPAEDFTFVKSDMSEGSFMDDIDAKVKVIIAVPSLDTGVCQMETRKFNEALGGKEGVAGIVISKDLPFAMNRFCEAEGISNVIIASDYRYNDFLQEYNTEILTGPFKGLSARAVFVVDEGHTIRYSELVPEVGQEPQYDEALAVIDELLG